MWCGWQIKMKGCSPCSKWVLKGSWTPSSHTHTLTCYICSSSDTTSRISWSGTSAAKFPHESDWQHSCLYSPSSPLKQKTAALLHSSMETSRLSVMGWPWLDSKSQSKLRYYSDGQRSENKTTWAFYRHSPAVLWHPPWTADGSLLPYGPPWAVRVPHCGLQGHLFWYLEELLFLLLYWSGCLQGCFWHTLTPLSGCSCADCSPFPNCVIPVSLPPLLMGPAMTSSRSVLEPASIGSVRHRKLLTEPTCATHHPTQWSC